MPDPSVGAHVLDLHIDGTVELRRRGRCHYLVPRRPDRGPYRAVRRLLERRQQGATRDELPTRLGADVRPKGSREPGGSGSVMRRAERDDSARHDGAAQLVPRSGLRLRRRSSPPRRPTAHLQPIAGPPGGRRSPPARAGHRRRRPAWTPQRLLSQRPVVRPPAERAPPRFRRNRAPAGPGRADLGRPAHRWTSVLLPGRVPAARPAA
jgi:hypothetical protein